MEKKIIKELIGHSGCEIKLIKDNDNFFVRKDGHITRNVERMMCLFEQGYRVPTIYDSSNSYIEMEYIQGFDIVEYLQTRSVNKLAHFINNTMTAFSGNGVMKDYSDVYDKKLDWVNEVKDLPFKKNEFVDRLPKMLPQSTYHGDFTLENLIYDGDEFIMIDPVTIEYDSYVFDLAKLRQDLECKWFLRNKNIKLDVKLQNLQEMIFDRHYLTNNDYLLILMLLRVYLHTKEHDSNRKFILKEIHRLWK